MAPTITLGLIGIGDMAAVHAAAAQRLGIPLAVAAGVNRERAERLAETTGARFFESVDALLAAPEVDAVDLCVPNDRHRAFTERAARAGKHILCEKPLALSLADADAMIAAARTAEVSLMVGHVVRFWPEYARLAALVRAGELGAVRGLSLQRLTGVLSATQGAEGWRAQPERSGGAVLDLQIHDVDFACWLLGKPSAIYARGIQSPDGAWDHLMTTLSFAHTPVQIEASFLMQSAPFTLGFHLFAERGVITYRYSPQTFALHGLHGEDAAVPEPAPSLWWYRAGAVAEALYTPERDSFELAVEAELAEFVASVAERRPPACPASEARQALAVSLAAQESCETGTVISLR